MGKVGESALHTIIQLNEWIDTHQDGGCDVSPSCLRCPFPECRYDAVVNLRIQRERARQERVLALWSAGHTPKEIMAIERISLSSVYRIRKERLGGIRAKGAKIEAERHEGYRLVAE